jgi:hypothetical protein
MGRYRKQGILPRQFPLRLPQMKPSSSYPALYIVSPEDQKVKVEIKSIAHLPTGNPTLSQVTDY